MAQKKEATEKLEIKDVFFDFDNVMAIALKRGVLKTEKSIAQEIGYSNDGYKKLNRKAPQAVATLVAFLKANDLKLEDVIKECESKK